MSSFTAAVLVKCGGYILNFLRIFPYTFSSCHSLYQLLLESVIFRDPFWQPETSHQDIFYYGLPHHQRTRCRRMRKKYVIWVKLFSYYLIFCRHRNFRFRIFFFFTFFYKFAKSRHIYRKSDSHQSQMSSNFDRCQEWLWLVPSQLSYIFPPYREWKCRRELPWQQ